jgi:hypothetical protein
MEETSSRIRTSQMRSKSKNRLRCHRRKSCDALRGSDLEQTETEGRKIRTCAELFQRHRQVYSSRRDSRGSTVRRFTARVLLCDRARGIMSTPLQRPRSEGKSQSSTPHIRQERRARLFDTGRSIRKTKLPYQVTSEFRQPHTRNKQRDNLHGKKIFRSPEQAQKD